MKARAYCFMVLMVATGGIRSAYGQSTGQIKGLVRDKATGGAIDNVSVSLLESHQQTKTGKGGTFAFSQLPFGSYSLRFSSVGYEERILNSIMLKESMHIQDLGVVFLDMAKNQLAEVVITPDKPLVEFGADTITFNAAQSIMAEGSVASDLLKSVPMVDVDIDGKPTIAGKVNTRIFINGKPSDYTEATMADLLNALPSDAIEKIEVVTNPDVRYSADGDGIINIVLAKGRKIGLNGSLTLTAGTIDNYNGNTYIAYRDEKISVNSSYGYRNNLRLTESAAYRSNYALGETDAASSFINQMSDGRNNQQGHNLQSSVDWNITPKQNVTVSANLNATSNASLSGMNDFRLNSQYVEQELREQQNINDTRGLNYEVKANYAAKFGNKNERLEAGLVAYSNAREQTRYITREIERANGRETDPFGQYMGNDIGNRRMEMSIDYRRSLTKLSTVSVGLQSTFADNSNDQLVTGADHGTGLDTVNSILTNLFKYRESVYAGYLSYNIRTKSRWSFKAGMRVEHTRLSLAESAVDNPDPRPYTNFFPNLSLNKVIRKKHNLGLSYSMRLTRPREHMLNPLINNSNPANVSFGNIDLLPSFIHQYQLSYGVSGKKWSFNPRLALANTGDIIERFRTSADSVTFLNLASRQAWTLHLVGNYKQDKNLTLNWGGMISMVDYRSPSPLMRDRRGWSSRGNIGASASLPRKIAAEARITYTNTVLSQGQRRGTVVTDFGFRKSLLSNKLLVRLMATDPFFNQNTLEYIDGLTASGATYLQENDRILRTSNYRLSVSYRFTKTGSKQSEDSPIAVAKME